MIYTIFYKHAFSFDMVWAISKRSAKRKAIKALKKEFEGEKFPMNCNDCGKQYVATSVEDFIDEIVGEPTLTFKTGMHFENA